MAIYNITVNYRINHRPAIWLSPEAETAYAESAAQQPEPENALPVPLIEYKEESLRKHMGGFMLAFLKSYGLEIHQYTPDMKAVEDFLAHRYGFWEDDAEHEDLFTFLEN